MEQSSTSMAPTINSVKSMLQLLQVGHSKGYVQVLVIGQESMLGTSTEVKITRVGRWSVFGEVIEPSPTAVNRGFSRARRGADSRASYASDAECHSTDIAVVRKEAFADSAGTTNKNGRAGTFISSIKPILLLRRRVKGSEEEDESFNKCEDGRDKSGRCIGFNISIMDSLLVGGLILSLLTIVLILPILLSQMLS